MNKLTAAGIANVSRRLLKDESGINTVEIVIILAVLVTLAFIFKDFIIDFAKGIFTKIKTSADENLGNA